MNRNLTALLAGLLLAGCGGEDAAPGTGGDRGSERVDAWRIVESYKVDDRINVVRASEWLREPGNEGGTLAEAEAALGLRELDPLPAMEAALGIASGELAALDPDGCLLTGPPPDGLLVARLAEVRVTAFDILGDRAALARLGAELVRLGAAPTGMGVFETLRIEAGRPEFGLDMDERTIPTEAGIDARAIDHGKGCYTGQEVIVRIRDRGHVNRHLRGLLLGDAPTPAPGTPLHSGTRAKPVGHVTSAALSPAFGQTIALGFVRREVVPPAELRLGDPDGAAVAVRALGDDGWELRPGDLR